MQENKTCCNVTVQEQKVLSYNLVKYALTLNSLNSLCTVMVVFVVRRGRVACANFRIQGCGGAQNSGEVCRLCEKQRRDATQVLPLKPRDTAFLDNHRMLHRRGELPQISKRYLLRFCLWAT